MPQETELRAKWVAAIEKTQDINSTITVFNVCIRHFENADVYLRGKEIILKNNAVPTVFENRGSLPENVNDSNDKTDETESLKKKIDELEKQILNLKIQHDVEFQHEQIKTKNAKQLQTSRFKACQKELSKKDSQLIQMNETMEELRANQLISLDDVKFLNVCPMHPCTFSQLHNLML